MCNKLRAVGNVISLYFKTVNRDVPSRFRSHSKPSLLTNFLDVQLVACNLHHNSKRTDMSRLTIELMGGWIEICRWVMPIGSSSIMEADNPGMYNLVGRPESTLCKNIRKWCNLCSLYYPDLWWEKKKVPRVARPTYTYWAEADKRQKKYLFFKTTLFWL